MRGARRRGIASFVIECRRGYTPEKKWQVGTSEAHALFASAREPAHVRVCLVTCVVVQMVARYLGVETDQCGGGASQDIPGGIDGT